MTIAAEQLTVRRLGRTVLHEVDLRIDTGDCVSVIGPNGAGKSTLMEALIAILPASSGRVTLHDEPLDRWSRREIARRIAYVPQIHEGYLGFTVRDVIESGRYVHLDPLSPLQDADRAAIDRAVTACAVEPLIDRPMQNLSGGERQKAWIAAALAQEASCLMLDEPTNALDPHHQAELIRIMRDFVAGGGTLIVICHDLNLPLSLGGRVVAMREGGVSFEGPAESLLEVSRLNELFDAPFTLHHDNAGRSSVHLAV